MSGQTKRTAAGAGTPATAKQNSTTEEAALFCNNSTPCNTEKQPFSVAKFLLRGEENALQTSELLRITEIPTARELQLIISSERESGSLILSTCGNGSGYFLPADGEQGSLEMRRFYNTLRARAINTLKTAKAAKRVLNSMGGDDI